MIHFHSVCFLCLYYYRYFGGGGGCGRQAGRQKVQILLPFCVLFICITKSSFFGGKVKLSSLSCSFASFAFTVFALCFRILAKAGESFSAVVQQIVIFILSSWSVPPMFKFFYFILPTVKRLFIRRCKCGSQNKLIPTLILFNLCGMHFVYYF